jgi:hypothetical protein
MVFPFVMRKHDRLLVAISCSTSAKHDRVKRCDIAVAVFSLELLFAGAVECKNQRCSGTRDASSFEQAKSPAQQVVRISFANQGRFYGW